MNSFFKTLIAGWGAAKLGGGCLGTILVFVIIYSLLGTCDNNTRAAIPSKPNAIHAQAAHFNTSTFVKVR